MGHRSGPRRSPGFLFGRLSHLTLHLGVFSSQVRHDAQYPFHEHQLTAAMHLVLLGAHQGFEPGLGRLAGIFGDLFSQFVIRQSFEKSGEALSLVLQQVDQLLFGTLLFLLRLELGEGGGPVVFLHFRRSRSVGFLPHARADRDMRQCLLDRAGTLGRREAILLFRNIFGYLDRVLADGAETRRKLLGSVDVLHTP
jgi:hypothetical protein